MHDGVPASLAPILLSLVSGTGRAGMAAVKKAGLRMLRQRQSGEGITRRECFSGDRESVRRQATTYALQTLWQQFLQTLDTV